MFYIDSSQNGLKLSVMTFHAAGSKVSLDLLYQTLKIHRHERLGSKQRFSFFMREGSLIKN